MKFNLIILLLLCNISLRSQVLQGGIAIGKSVYWGDLNSPEFSSNLNNNGGLAIQAFGKWNYKQRYALKLGLMMGKLKAEDNISSQAWQKERNLSFYSRIFELSAMGEYYFFGFDPLTSDKPFSPYITGGIAAIYFDPKADYLGSTYNLQSLGTEGQGNPGFGNKYSKVAISLPFGAGAIMKISRSVNVNFDVVARRAFTDYIDDISGSYVNYNELRSLNGIDAANLADRTNEFYGINEPLQRVTGTQRGGEFVSDWYFTAMVGFSFFISDPDNSYRRKSNYKSSCPKF